MFAYRVPYISFLRFTLYVNRKTKHLHHDGGEPLNMFRQLLCKSCRIAAALTIRGQENNGRKCSAEDYRSDAPTHSP